MNVLYLSPGFPDEMTQFVEGLAAVGAAVYGVGEAPQAALPPRCKASLTAYLQVPSLWDEEDALQRIVAEVRLRGLHIDRVSCLWEPLVILAGRIREALRVPGMDVQTSVPFRDKETMKQVLDAAGLRTPHHARCSDAEGVRAAAARIGYPLIIKPIAGAGSADTHRVDDAEGLEAALAATTHVPEVSVEEFIDGEEFTYDTICARGRILFENVCWYRPRPLIARQEQWTSPQTIAVRDLSQERIRPGIELGRAVIKALGLETGFTHMEWFLTDSGEAVFGEIGARPPGARTTDVMNFCVDADLHKAYGHALCYGDLHEPLHRRYNSASIFKRAQGDGRIHAIEGLASLMGRYGPHIMSVELLPIGAPRRNWKQTLMSDGHLFVRHPDLQSLLEITDAVGTDLQLYAS